MDPRAWSHHSRSLPRGYIRSKTSTARARDPQIERKDIMIELEADKAKQVKLREDETLETQAQEATRDAEALVEKVTRGT